MWPGKTKPFWGSRFRFRSLLDTPIPGLGVLVPCGDVAWPPGRFRGARPRVVQSLGGQERLSPRARATLAG